MVLAKTVQGNDSLNCTGKLDKEGRKNGTWVCRNKEGRLIRKERFKHGDLMTWMVYNTKGQMIETRDKKGKIRKYTPCGC
jgi:YD repeat-containing protein